MTVLPIMLLSLVTTLAELPEPPAAAANAAASTGDSEPEVPRFQNASELLDALEKADRDIRTFSATIRYTKLYALAQDVQTRQGDLWFRTDPPADAGATDAGVRHRWVAVKFNKLIAGRRVDEQERVWVFDGEWLVEKDPVEKQFIKRRVARPGEAFDPLRVGEGPFFVPVGQKREDMETYFDAALVPYDTGLTDEDPDRSAMFRSLADHLKGLIQLELTPRPGLRQVEDFSIIRIWYDPKTLLPRASMSVSELDDVDVFELFDIDVNEQRRPIPPDAFSVQTPGPSEGYHVEIMDETLDRQSGASEREGG